MSVSVIIPAYNAEGVLGSALASVAAQTRQPDEVIVVDDGSSDATSTVAQRWSEHLPVHVLRFEDNIGGGLGAGAARHEGILASRGSTVALLDADDVMLPDHLEVLVGLHERCGGLVTANHLLWLPGSALGSTPVSDLIPVPEADRQWRALISENFVFIATVFSRALYDQAGGFRSIRCEDWDLWIRMVGAGATVHMPAHPTALYRASPGSVSAGDRLLIGDIDLLTELLGTVPAEDRSVVERALRRRRAKQRLLRGIELYEGGHRLSARREWIAALAQDLSFRGNNSRLNGRVATRALACLALPGPMVRRRRDRQRSASRVVGAR